MRGLRGTTYRALQYRGEPPKDDVLLAVRHSGANRPAAELCHSLWVNPRSVRCSVLGLLSKYPGSHITEQRAKPRDTWLEVGTDAVTENAVSSEWGQVSERKEKHVLSALGLAIGHVTIGILCSTSLTCVCVWWGSAEHALLLV